MHALTIMSGASQIYMKRHIDGQGDKQTAITHCGVNLLHVYTE
jgi:hypothetical protein